MEKGIKYSQDQSSIRLNFSGIILGKHNAVVLRVTVKSIMFKFFSIMYLTLSLSLNVISIVLFKFKSSGPRFFKYRNWPVLGVKFLKKNTESSSLLFV